MNYPKVNSRRLSSFAYLFARYADLAKIHNPESPISLFNRPFVCIARVLHREMKLERLAETD